MTRSGLTPAIALTLALLLAACQGGGGGQPSPEATPTADSTPTPAPVETEAPEETQAPEETDEPEAGGDFPNEAEAELLTHIPEAFRDECSRSDFGASGIATIGCGITAAGGDISITYNLFDSEEEMNAAYGRTLEFVGIEPDGGTCSREWPAEESYTINAQTAGRVGCGEFGGQALIISWTDTQLLISGYAEGFGVDQAEFYKWWTTDSGPV